MNSGSATATELKTVKGQIEAYIVRMDSETQEVRKENKAMAK